MKFVIDISNEDYIKLKYGRIAVRTMRTVLLNGTPLPKGHGRLIDADYVIGRLDSGYDVDVIRYAPTVIEADNEI